MGLRPTNGNENVGLPTICQEFVGPGGTRPAECG